MKNLSNANFIDVNNHRKKARSELGGLSLNDISHLSYTNKTNFMNYAKVISELEKINNIEKANNDGDETSTQMDENNDDKGEFDATEFKPGAKN